MTVVPLFCARFLRTAHLEEDHVDTRSWFGRLIHRFNHRFELMLDHYSRTLNRALARPVATVAGLLGVCALTLLLFPFLGVSFFPRTDPGQFVINLKAPSGTRLELTEESVGRVEEEIRKVVPEKDLGMIVSNIGTTPGFSSIYTPNSAPHTAFVQVSLKEGHRVGSYEYMDRVRHRLRGELPELTTYFQSGGLVDAVLNLGLPAPIDVQVSGMNLEKAYATASQIAFEARKLPGRERRPRSPGSRLPVPAPRRRPQPREPRRAIAEGGRPQRDHGAHVEPDDRAELLGRSEDRQRLHADRAVSRRTRSARCPI